MTLTVEITVQSKTSMMTLLKRMFHKSRLSPFGSTCNNFLKNILLLTHATTPNLVYLTAGYPPAVASHRAVIHSFHRILCSHLTMLPHHHL
ncbi:uncharacterized protein DS421_8g233840 [Arachis hypogaea]|nr:uncharacterized protein DS421_8g233840 [Arachis hypogaea]